VIQLVYETHSISVDNERGIATGWLPGKLSKAGRESARALGARRRDDGIAVVFTSDLRRAVETAEIAFADATTPVHQDARLRECDYGELNGAPAERVAATRLDRIDVRFPGGESYVDVVERTREFLADLLSDHDGSRILVIAHSANRWALQHLLEGVPLVDAISAPFSWQEGWEYPLERAAIL
jgi:broad specificity phosphatase PhoE